MRVVTLHKTILDNYKLRDNENEGAENLRRFKSKSQNLFVLINTNLNPQVSQMNKIINTKVIIFKFASSRQTYNSKPQFEVRSENP